MSVISQRELRNNSGAIMRRVERGERFTVTRNGVPIAELIPLDPSSGDNRRQFVPIAQIAAGVERLPRWDTERFASESERLDQAVDDQDVDHWPKSR